MRRQTSSHTPSAEVDRQLDNTAYENVLIVVRNMASIVATGANTANINTVALVSEDITLLAPIADALSSLAADKVTLASLYADKATLDSLFADKAAIDSLFADKIALDSLYADKAKLDSIFADKAAIDLVAANLNIDGVSGAIQKVANASNLADIIKVADDLNEIASDIDLVGADLGLGVDSNIDKVGGSIGNVDIVGASIDNVNTFADIYQVSATEPTLRADGSALLAGDLWFDTVVDSLKKYDGAVYVDTTVDSLADVTLAFTNKTITDVSNEVGAPVVSYDNTISGLTAVNAKTALDEIVERAANHIPSTPSSQQYSGVLSIETLLNKLMYEGITYTGQQSNLPQDLGQAVVPINGTFDTTTGWTSVGSAVISGGVLTTTDVGGSNYAHHAITVEVDTLYTIDFEVVSSTFLADSTLYVGTTTDGTTGKLNVNKYPVVGNNSVTVNSGANTTLYVVPRQGGAGGSSVTEWDNITIRKSVTTPSALGEYVWNGSNTNIYTGLNTIDFTVASNGTGFWFDRTVNQVKNDAGVHQVSGSINFGAIAGIDGICDVHIKSRTLSLSSHVEVDGIRGVGEILRTDTTDVETAVATSVTGFTSTGFTLGNYNWVNALSDTYIAYINLYTHITWGVTNHGKFYVEAYNPVTNETLNVYLGSGATGHELPHSVGSALDLVVFKNLVQLYSWTIQNELDGSGKYLLYSTASEQTSTNLETVTTSTVLTLDVSTNVNELDSLHIMKGKAKSKTWTSGTYIGNNSTNAVETVDVNGVVRKPARVIIKSLSGIGDWELLDNKRGDDVRLKLNDSVIEASTGAITFNINGFTLLDSNASFNATGIKYVYLVQFDTNADGGGSYADVQDDTTGVPALTATGLGLMFSDGMDENGASNSTEVVADGTITINGGFDV